MRNKYFLGIIYNIIEEYRIEAREYNATYTFALQVVSKVP